MRITTRLLQYGFRYWKRYIERNLYKNNSKELWRPIVGWNIVRKDKANFYYDENRPWTAEFQNNNLPTKKRPKVYVEPIKDWVIVKGDLVQILVGKDKGKRGIVSSIIKERNWCFVESLNCEYKMEQMLPDSEPTCIKKELPLLVTTQVKLIDPSDEKPTEVEWRYTEKGERVRVSKRTGRIIAMPTNAAEWEDFVLPMTFKETDKDTKEKILMEVTFEPKIMTFEEEIRKAMNIKEDRTQPANYWY